MDDESKLPQENPIPDNIDINRSKKAAEEALLHLSGQQRGLYEALAEKDIKLASMYYGAIKVISDGSNPDRLTLAAHGLRELIEKIPSYLDIQIKAGAESLKVKVRELEGQWELAKSSSSCFQNPNWNGEIDKPLEKLLKKVQYFFDWFKEQYPRRRAEIAKTLRKLDSSARSVPKPLEELRVEEWERVRDFFQAVAHHRIWPSFEEFQKWLDALEKFLLDRLRPRAFEDLSAIDALIREGESND